VSEWRRIPKLPRLGKYPTKPRILPTPLNDVMLTSVNRERKEIYIGFFDSDGYLHGWPCVDMPTHWMPLPEPPTDDTSQRKS
jgi:hypothetical protein